MVKVKICGITSEDDLEAAVAAGADSIGFVVNAPRSPRNLSLERAADLIGILPDRVDGVAVTVFTELQDVKKICMKLRPRIIQLHGLPLKLDCREKLPTDTRLTLAVSSTSQNVIEEGKSCAKFADAVLVDTHSANGYGGTGGTHDWNTSRRVREMIHPVPMILAGGLTVENVGHAARTVRPFGVDVSTGVETRPGHKNHEKIIEFVKRAKEVEF
jgi:phosphoribosylanthranilate isomerase